MAPPPLATRACVAPLTGPSNTVRLLLGLPRSAVGKQFLSFHLWLLHLAAPYTNWKRWLASTRVEMQIVCRGAGGACYPKKGNKWIIELNGNRVYWRGRRIGSRQREGEGEKAAVAASAGGKIDLVPFIRLDFPVT